MIDSVDANRRARRRSEIAVYKGRPETAAADGLVPVRHRVVQRPGGRPKPTLSAVISACTAASTLIAAPRSASANPAQWSRHRLSSTSLGSKQLRWLPGSSAAAAQTSWRRFGIPDLGSPPAIRFRPGSKRRTSGPHSSIPIGSGAHRLADVLADAQGQDRGGPTKGSRNNSASATWPA